MEALTSSQKVTVQSYGCAVFEWNCDGGKDSPAITIRHCLDGHAFLHRLSVSEKGAGWCKATSVVLSVIGPPVTVSVRRL